MATFNTREAAEAHVKSLGFTFDRHEPWAFSYGFDFYTRGSEQIVIRLAPRADFIAQKREDAASDIELPF